MIRQSIYIEEYDWLVYCYFATHSQDAPEILDMIDRIGISEDKYHQAEEHLFRSDYNSGITFSNIGKRASVMVFSHTSSARQMLNTFAHELRHLADDIALASNIPSRGEQVAYLTGDIAMTLAASLLQIVCDCPICSFHK